MIAILPLLREFPEELEADFWHFYNLDIRGLWTGKLTPRQVRVLIKNLSTYGSESATVRKKAGPTATWSQTEHLLAALIDSMNSLIYLYQSAHVGTNVHVPKPVPVRRPGDPDPVEESAFPSAAEQAQQVAMMLKRLGSAA
jgi:hypothetical protein